MNDESQNNKKKYDLAERTAKFAEEIIEFAMSLPKTPVNLPLITQLVKAGTSIGANYEEADGAESRKDFNHKIAICKKESKETKYWLRVIIRANPDKKEKAQKLWQESQEFTLIFSSIIISSKKAK